jgi:hypothetical protein
MALTLQMKVSLKHPGTHDNIPVTQARIQADDDSCVLASCTMHGAGSWDFWLLRTEGVHGLAWASATNNSITLYRGMLDPSWNDIRVRIWKPKQNP